MITRLTADLHMLTSWSTRSETPRAASTPKSTKLFSSYSSTHNFQCMHFKYATCFKLCDRIGVRISMHACWNIQYLCICLFQQAGYRCWWLSLLVEWWPVCPRTALGMCSLETFADWPVMDTVGFWFMMKTYCSYGSEINIWHWIWADDRKGIDHLFWSYFELVAPFGNEASGSIWNGNGARIYLFGACSSIRNQASGPI